MEALSCSSPVTVMTTTFSTTQAINTVSTTVSTTVSQQFTRSTPVCHTTSVSSVTNSVNIITQLPQGMIMYIHPPYVCEYVCVYVHYSDSYILCIAIYIAFFTYGITRTWEPTLCGQAIRKNISRLGT